MGAHLAKSQIIRPTDAAKLLGISKATFWRIVKRGDIKTFKVTDRTTGVLASDLEAYIAARTVEAEA